MVQPTIIPRDPSLVAVAKDGKFLGYADRTQVDREGLELFLGDAPAPEKEPEQKPKETSEEGASPTAVRKGPAKPKADA